MYRSDNFLVPGVKLERYHRLAEAIRCVVSFGLKGLRGVSGGAVRMVHVRLGAGAMIGMGSYDWHGEARRYGVMIGRGKGSWSAEKRRLQRNY